MGRSFLVRIKLDTLRANLSAADGEVYSRADVRRCGCGDDAIGAIAKQLGVNPADVIGMDQRIRSGGDESLNVTFGAEDENGAEWQDFMVETRPNQEAAYFHVEETRLRRGQLQAALSSLDEREHELWKSRVLAGNLYINRGTTGAVVLRQPFGGMGKSLSSGATTMAGSLF